MQSADKVIFHGGKIHNPNVHSYNNYGYSPQIPSHYYYNTAHQQFYQIPVVVPRKLSPSELSQLQYRFQQSLPEQLKGMNLSTAEQALTKDKKEVKSKEQHNTIQNSSALHQSTTDSGQTSNILETPEKKRKSNEPQFVQQKQTQVPKKQPQKPKLTKKQKSQEEKVQQKDQTHLLKAPTPVNTPAFVADQPSKTENMDQDTQQQKNRIKIKELYSHLVKVKSTLTTQKPQKQTEKVTQPVEEKEKHSLTQVKHATHQEFVSLAQKAYNLYHKKPITKSKLTQKDKGKDTKPNVKGTWQTHTTQLTQVQLDIQEKHINNIVLREGMSVAVSKEDTTVKGDQVETETGQNVQEDMQAEPIIVNSLKKPQTLDFYHDQYQKAEVMKLDNFEVQEVYFDTSVQNGPSQAIKFLQKAVGLNQDGILGPETVDKVNSSDPEYVCNKLIDYRLEYTEKMTLEDPKQSKFQPVWNNRTNKLREEVALFFSPKELPIQQEIPV